MPLNISVFHCHVAALGAFLFLHWLDRFPFSPAGFAGCPILSLAPRFSKDPSILFCFVPVLPRPLSAPARISSISRRFAIDFSEISPTNPLCFEILFPYSCLVQLWFEEFRSPRFPGSIRKESASPGVNQPRTLILSLFLLDPAIR